MPSPNDALPAHVWEITVQVENGDWHYTRTPKTTFDEAVDQAVWFKSNFGYGKLISIQDVDPEERPRPPKIPGSSRSFTKISNARTLSATVEGARGVRSIPLPGES